uniref:Uncharacterized protein n=1 Tax=Arundo donax TaxID=35708 RepID=A0A0A8Y4I2_ARUDO
MYDGLFSRFGLTTSLGSKSFALAAPFIRDSNPKCSLERD